VIRRLPQALVSAVVFLSCAAPRAQEVPRVPRTTVASRVACRVHAIVRAPAEGMVEVAPPQLLGRTGPGAAAIELPPHWSWWLEPEAPEAFTAQDLADLVTDVADASPPALSLAGCARLRDVDLEPLRRLDGLRQLDLSGCRGLTGAALALLHDLPALAWLRTDGSRIDPDAVAVRGTRRADDAVRAALAEHSLVGVAAAIVVDGRLAHARGYGFSDREAELSVSPTETSFRWASISKTVTAVAALQLVERDELTLEADVRTLVPEFPDKGAVLTIRQLLCHQAGIVHYRNGPVVRTERTYDVEHPFVDPVLALDAFKESPLVCPPGSRYSYSTHGYILLGAAVQRAGAEPYQEQVHERIALPLGMTTFRPDYEWEVIPGRTRGYRRDGEAIRRSRDVDVSWKLAGGGFTSCVVDLARFGQGLLGGTLLRRETQAAMFTAQATADGKRTRYGLGIQLGVLPGGVAWFGHSGAQEKTRTMLLLVPSRQVGVAVMCNSEWADSLALARALAAAALETSAR